MGRCASDLPLFRASIRVLTPRGNSQSQKSCNFGRISVFLGTRIGLMLVPWAGCLGAAPLLMTLGSVVGGAGSAARCGDASGGATWAAGCLGQRDAVNGVGLA